MESNSQLFESRTLSWLTLFASTGTLICCALPITLVTLGLGTTVAALTALCSNAHVWNRRIYWLSVIIWSAGFFAAYLALPLRIGLER